MAKIFALLLTLMIYGSVKAETYQIYLGVAPGGPADVMVRKIFAEMEKRTKDTFVVLNRPGSDFVVSYQAFQQESTRNRNVIFVNNAGFYLSTQTDYAHLNINPITDSKSLITLVSFDMLIISRKGSPIRGMADLRGKINLGYAGTTTKLLAEKLNLDPNIYLIPYKSDPAVIMALLADEVPVGTTLDISPIYRQYRQNFQVIGNSKQLLGVSNAFGLSVPQRMPDAQVTALNLAINQVLSDPEFIDWFVKTYHKRPHGGNPQEFDSIITDFYRKVSAGSTRK